MDTGRATGKSDKKRELKPPGIEFAPLFKCLIVRIFISVFYSKTSNVHSPVRDSRQREVYTRRNLIPEVAPPRHYVAAPRSRSVALLSCIGAPRKDKHPLLGARNPLPFIQVFRVHQR